jgi:hypothetical protein
VQPVLADAHRDRQQLGELMAPRFRSVNPVCLSERVRTRAAALRPMLDDLVDPFGRKQPPVLAFMPGLATTSTARPFPTRIGASLDNARHLL